MIKSTNSSKLFRFIMNKKDIYISFLNIKKESLIYLLFKTLLILSLLLNNLEREYIIYEKKKNQNNIKTNSSSLKIFIMAHKDFENHRYNPIYSIVADSKQQLKKKYNLNIFYATEGKLYNMSRSYGEMSKLYFIYQLYKNGTISSNYIGLSHYRRYFEFGDNIPYLDHIFEKYDVILNKQTKMKINVKNHYCKFHICKNFDELLDIIKVIKPDYYKTAMKTSKEKHIYFCNLFIMKKEDFFNYCKFVYDILFEFDFRHNFTSDKDVFDYTKKYFNDSIQYDFQSRLDGFLAERISNIFFRKYFKKIKLYKMVTA